MLGWIFLTITPLVLSQVTAYTTSFEVWTTLVAIFNVKSKTRILQLKNRLNNFKKEHLYVEDFIAELTRLAKEAHEVGVALDDGELTLIALNNLDNSYDAFVTAQSARADEITFAEFQGLLQAHKNRYSRPTAATSFPMANAVTKDGVICQICLKRGHTVILCFNRHNESRFSTVIDKRPRYRSKSSTTGNSNSTNAIWYPDSRATYHIVAEASNIQTKDFASTSMAILTANGN